MNASVVEVEKIRLAAVRRGEWPESSLEMWSAIATDPKHPRYEHAVRVIAAAKRKQ